MHIYKGPIKTYIKLMNDNDFEVNKLQMKSTLDSVLSLFDKVPGLTDYLADRLLELAESIPDHKNITSKYETKSTGNENPPKTTNFWPQVHFIRSPPFTEFAGKSE